jgi:hypothetical protein
MKRKERLERESLSNHLLWHNLAISFHHQIRYFAFEKFFCDVTVVSGKNNSEDYIGIDDLQ